MKKNMDRDQEAGPIREELGKVCNCPISCIKVRKAKMVTPSNYPLHLCDTRTHTYTIANLHMFQIWMNEILYE